MLGVTSKISMVIQMVEVTHAAFSYKTEITNQEQNDNEFIMEKIHYHKPHLSDERRKELMNRAE